MSLFGTVQAVISKQAFIEVVAKMPDQSINQFINNGRTRRPLTPIKYMEKNSEKNKIKNKIDKNNMA